MNIIRSILRRAVVVIAVAVALASPGAAQGNAHDAALSGSAAGHAAHVATTTLSAGMPLSIEMMSPGGTLNGLPYFLGVDLIPPNGPSPISLPGEPGAVALTTGLVPLLNSFGQSAAPGLPGAGLEFAMTTPHVYVEADLVFQGAVADPTAVNGIAITETSGGRFGSPPTITQLSPSTTQLGQFGYALLIHDLDGDGIPEIIGGARADDAPTQTTGGRVYIHTGLPPTLVQILDDPAPDAASDFGVSASAGDVNGDGFEDLVIGARQHDEVGVNDAGRVIIFFGPSYAVTHTLTPPHPEPRGQFGHRTVCGDFDGDGYDDVAVSSIGAAASGFAQAGTVEVYFGPSLAPSLTIPNPVPGVGDRFGYRLSSRDLNADGFADLTVAAPFKTLIPGSTDSSGALFVFMGPSLINTLYFPNPVPSPAGLLGADMVVEDLDDDGNLDIIAGAELDNSGGLAGQGSVYVLHGPSFTTTQQIFAPNPVTDGGFGAGLDVGDFNGDLICDLMVGEFYFSAPGFHAGQASVLFGPDLLTSITVQEPVPGTSNQFGRRVRAGDLDGDGDDEMIVGTPFSSANGVLRSGTVYIVEQ